MDFFFQFHMKMQIYMFLHSIKNSFFVDLFMVHRDVQRISKKGGDEIFRDANFFTNVI